MPIEQVHGQIKHGDEVLLDNLALCLEVVTGSGGVESWHGSFSPPKDAPIDVGNSYRLELDDGRTGNLIVDRMELGSHKDTVATFQGRGRLMRATI